MPDVGGFTDPGMPLDGVMLEPFNSGVGPTTRVWYKPNTWRTEGWTLEKRSFNSYFREEVPGRAKRNVEYVPTGRTRDVSVGGKCWTEREVVEHSSTQRYYLVTRRVEWWNVNTTLASYYNFVTGEAITHAGTGIAVATVTQGGRNLMQATGRAVIQGAIGTTAPELVPALGAAAPGAITASGVIGAAGLGIAVFCTTTYLMRGWIADAELISAGWEIQPDKSGFGPKENERIGTPPIWQIAGEVHDCPDMQDTEHGVIPGTGQPPRTATGPRLLFRIPWWGWLIFFVLVASLGFAISAMLSRGSTTAPAAALPGAASAVAPAVTVATVPVEPNRPPSVTELSASLVVPVTTYAVTASDPDGDVLTYSWRMTGEPCGTPKTPWTQPGQSVRWSHASTDPDNCSHISSDHSVVTVVTVTDSKGAAVECTINGSETQRVPNPQCRPR